MSDIAQALVLLRTAEQKQLALVTAIRGALAFVNAAPFGQGPDASAEAIVSIREAIKAFDQ